MHLFHDSDHLLRVVIEVPLPWIIYYYPRLLEAATILLVLEEGLSHHAVDVFEPLQYSQTGQLCIFVEECLVLIVGTNYDRLLPIRRLVIKSCLPKEIWRLVGHLEVL